MFVTSNPARLFFSGKKERSPESLARSAANKAKKEEEARNATLPPIIPVKPNTDLINLSAGDVPKYMKYAEDFLKFSNDQALKRNNSVVKELRRLAQMVLNNKYSPDLSKHLDEFCIAYHEVFPREEG